MWTRRRARAFLHVSSTAPVMGFAVSFSDVAPDGSSHLIAKGMLNATRRRSLIDPEPLTAGEVVELDIPIDATAWRFSPGHRIRVAVASADLPNVWPAPEPGGTKYTTGLKRLSRLVLPVVPQQGSATPPSFAPTPKEVTQSSAGIPPPRWEVTRDVLTGRTRVTIDLTKTNRVNPSTVIRQEMLMVNEVDPRDPAHANSRGRFLARVERPQQSIEARSYIAIQGTPSAFQVVIDHGSERCRLGIDHSNSSARITSPSKMPQRRIGPAPPTAHSPARATKRLIGWRRTGR